MAQYSHLYATLAMILIIFNSITKAQINSPCSSSVISSFTPCLNYLTGSTGTSSSPTEDCCNSLKSLMAGNMDCVCLIVTGNVPVTIPFFNASLASLLPRACRNYVPLQCKATGVPLPPPGPVIFGPGPSPGGAHAPSPRSHSPKASKAVATAMTLPLAESLAVAPAPAASPIPFASRNNPRRITPVAKLNIASTLQSKFHESLILLVMFVGTNVAFHFF